MRFYKKSTAASRRSRAFTLIELLITLTIFAIVSVISVTLLVNGLRSAKKIQAQVLLYGEAQALMDQIAYDVERSTVDYEAYFSRNVLAEDGWETPNYGWYSQSFFNPGDDGLFGSSYEALTARGFDYYGVACPSDGVSEYPKDCSDELPDYSDLDTETGMHPFNGYFDLLGDPDDPSHMNAFCRGESGGGSADCDSPTVGFTDELILTNSAGDERIVYALKALADSASENGLARLVLTGTDGDSDGIEETWECSNDYECDVAEDPDIYDFAYLSPPTIVVESFDVLVAPTEDPYRAFGELDSQIQPQVMIVMTVTLSSDYSLGLLGEMPSITIQRTISTGVYSKVVSYE